MLQQQWRGRKKYYLNEPRENHGKQTIFAVLAVVFLGGLLYGIVNLTRYGGELAAAKRIAVELRDAYEAVDEPYKQLDKGTDKSKTSGGAVQLSNIDADQLQITESGNTEFVQASLSEQMLNSIAYPDNPGAIISERFQSLRKRNRDITGWLKIEGVLDEAVVQRDNVFYLNHDATGKTNSNGALFLEASISIRTRPYSLVIYGHNMKSGAMFGSLRNYENPVYLHKNPMISFETLYEKGRYVIFAVGEVSMDTEAQNYMDFSDLSTRNVEQRKSMINTLINASVLTCTVDVAPEDQLLLLVTCVDEAQERRVVAARRIRDNESELKLRELVSTIQRKATVNIQNGIRNE